MNLHLPITLLTIGANLGVLAGPALACHGSRCDSEGFMGMPGSQAQAIPGYMTGVGPYRPGMRARYRRMRFQTWQAGSFPQQFQRQQPGRYIREYHWPDSTPVQANTKTQPDVSESVASAGSVPFIPFDAPINWTQQPVAVRQVRGEILKPGDQSH